MSTSADKPHNGDHADSDGEEPRGGRREGDPTGRSDAAAGSLVGRFKGALPPWLGRAGSFLLDVYNHTMRDDVLTWSGSLAYTELFGLFPFLIFLRSLLPYVPRVQELIVEAQQTAEEALGPDSELYTVLNDNVFSQLGVTSTTLLSVSALIALYSASSILAKMVRAINQAYDFPESRSWLRRRLMGAALTVWVAFFLPVSLLMIVLGPTISDALAGALPGNEIYTTLWNVFKWPLVLLLQAAGLSLLYRFGPAQAPRWRSILPGSLVAIVGIALGSLGFSWYLGSQAFSPSWVTYGVLGTAMVLLFWMYIVSAAILVGGEVNGTVHRRAQAAKEQREQGRAE